MGVRSATAPRFAGFTEPEGAAQEDDDLMSFVDTHATGGVMAAADPDDDEDEADDDEYDDEDDEDEDDEADQDDDEQDAVADQPPAETLDQGALTVQWVDRGDGIYLMRISGDMYAQINEEQRGSEKPVFTSIHFNGDQTTLRKALDAIGRNAVSRAVRVAWETAHPKDTKPRAARASTSTKAEIDALREEMAADRALLRQVLAAVGGADAGGDADDEQDEAPAPPQQKSRLRIART